MRRFSAMVALVACAGGAPSPKAAPHPAPVLVTVVVDQLAAWVARERWPILPATGGFARLRREGTWWQDMRYAHAVTDTGPGHAALYSGEPPRTSGIYTNDLLDAAGKEVSLLADPATRILGAGGTRAPGVSLAPLRLPLLGDRLRAARPDAVIVSISLKDRAALLGGGRRPDAALWFDQDLDEIATSSAVAAAFPDWARPLGSHDAVVRRRAAPWIVLDPAWLAAHVEGPDDAPGEGDLFGYGTTFPHRVAASTKPAKAFRDHPAADALVLDLALAGIDALARPRAPLLVALSLSANDYIGHVFGPRSWESLDNLLRLDAALARFMDGLDQRFGPEGWSLLLTADHGIIDRPGTLLMPKPLEAELEAAADAELGPGPWLVGVGDPYLLFHPRAASLPPAERARLRAAVTRALRARPEVAAVADPATEPAACPPESDESLDALLCRSVVPGAVDGLYVVLEPGFFFDPDVVPGYGASHGSPWLYDRSVPLVARAPGRVAAGRVEEAPISYRRFAELAAALLGI